MHDNQDVLLAQLMTLLIEAANGNCFPIYKMGTVWTFKQVRKYFYHVKVEKVNTRNADIAIADMVKSLDTC